jgi:hypothetical protein
MPDVLAGMGVRPPRSARREEETMNAWTSQSPPVLANGRSYAWPAGPTVVVCIDGSEPGYIEEAIARRRAESRAADGETGANLLAEIGDAELHQSQQPVDHHRPPARRARHRRQLTSTTGEAGKR